jgi:hypothetical protein
MGSAFAWPHFGGGRRAGLIRYAQASCDEMVAIYRRVAIDAYREVEDNLAAVKQIADDRAARPPPRSMRGVRLRTPGTATLAGLPLTLSS